MPRGSTQDEISPAGDRILLAADVLSLVSCIWLLCKIRRLPAAQRQRLFPRQVVVLAASDLCMVLASYVMICLRVPLLCLGHKVTVSWTIHFTLLAELQIVFGFAAQMFGALEASGRLLSCLWLPWLLATTVAGIEIGLSDSGSSWAGVAPFAACFCFLMALLTFVAVLCRARTSNTAMARRSWRRASTYVANFLVTFAPMVYATLYARIEARDEWMWLRYFGVVGLHLNGCVNGLTYFAQSRYSQSAPQTHKDQHAAQSLIVRFEGVTLEDLVDDAPEDTV